MIRIVVNLVRCITHCYFSKLYEYGDFCDVDYEGVGWL